MNDDKLGTVHLTITADTTKFHAAMYDCWKATWRLRIARHPITGRVAYWWAWLHRAEAWKRLDRERNAA